MKEPFHPLLRPRAGTMGAGGWMGTEGREASRTGFVCVNRCLSAPLEWPGGTGTGEVD